MFQVPTDMLASASLLQYNDVIELGYICMYVCELDKETHTLKVFVWCKGYGAGM